MKTRELTRQKLKTSVSAHQKEIFDYCDDIASGKIKSSIYTKKAVERFKSDIERENDADFLYDPGKVDEVIVFAENLFISDLNKKLKLLPWIKFIYANLFGFVNKNNSRRFRSGYIEVARKNSKTTSLLFPIILWDFFTTASAESYFVSKDMGQSAKAFLDLQSIILKTFNLPGDIKVTDNCIRRINDNSFIRFFSSEIQGIDSYKNSCSVIDEFHAYDNDKVITSFKYGGRARKNSKNLVLIITSAGTDISNPCYAENEKARKVLNGILTDESYFTVIYAYDDGDDWKNPDNFIKANPSLGAIIDKKILENDLHDALITPSHQSDFKAKTCGIWTNDVSNWIPLNKWDTVKRNSQTSISDFIGQNCYAGLDLSSINDFTAYSKCFFRNGLYYLYHKFYIPSEQVSEKYRVENINIMDWVDKGIVTATNGPTIDYNYIIKDIREDYEKYNIIELAYDRWQSNKLIDQLDDEFPNTVFVKYDQSLKSMANPTKEFEKLIYEDKIVDNNPVMKWMVSNSVIKPDINNNYKVLKNYKSSNKRIDGVITSIMSIDRANANKGNEIPEILTDEEKMKRLLSLFG